MPFSSLYPPGMANQQFRSNLFNPFGIPIPTPGVRPLPPPSASSSSSSSSNRHHQTYDGSPRKYEKHQEKKIFFKRVFLFLVSILYLMYNDQKNLI
jgi:hypothetical protein